MIKHIKMKLKSWKPPRSVKYLTLCGVPMLICLGIWWSVDDWEAVFPTEEALAGQQRQLKKLRQELEFERQKHHDQDAELSRLRKESVYFYVPDEKHKPDIFMRQKLEEIAKHAGLVVKSLSDIRKQNIVKGINSLEADVLVEGDLKQTVAFLQELSDSKPAFYWQQCNLRPAGPNTGNALIANGTLKLFGRDDGEPGELSEVLKQ